MIYYTSTKIYYGAESIKLIKTKKTKLIFICYCTIVVIIDKTKTQFTLYLAI